MAWPMTAPSLDTIRERLANFAAAGLHVYLDADEAVKWRGEKPTVGAVQWMKEHADQIRTVLSAPSPLSDEERGRLVAFGYWRQKHAGLPLEPER